MKVGPSGMIKRKQARKQMVEVYTNQPRALLVRTYMQIPRTQVKLLRMSKKTPARKKARNQVVEVYKNQSRALLLMTYMQIPKTQVKLLRMSTKIPAMKQARHQVVEVYANRPRALLLMRNFLMQMKMTICSLANVLEKEEKEEEMPSM